MADHPPEATRYILFCKYPAPGCVKTRLIPVLGEEGAALLQQRLISRTLREMRIAAGPGAALEVRYTGGTKEAFFQLFNETAPLASQGGGDIGERMHRAFLAAFGQGIKKAILFGADIPELTAHTLTRAALLLDQHDAVIGPARDGGYYLIAMRRPLPSVFEAIPWSTSGVLEATVRELKRLRLSFALIETLRDVDRPDDLTGITLEALSRDIL
jgi:rSAM/selenodomain-associated transferase 1